MAHKREMIDEPVSDCGLSKLTEANILGMSLGSADDGGPVSAISVVPTGPFSVHLNVSFERSVELG
jgi:hypothetical protein